MAPKETDEAAANPPEQADQPQSTEKPEKPEQTDQPSHEPGPHGPVVSVETVSPDKPQDTSQEQAPATPEPVVIPAAAPASAVYPTPQTHPTYQPQAPPPATPPNPAEEPPVDNSPGILVLQWLTYAFWGWTVLAMSILTATVLANFIADADTGGFTPYGIAAVLVLLPIAAVCDRFYSKHEFAKKSGPASLIMIIHAVIFAIFGIGSLIWAAFALVTLFTSSSDSSSSMVGLFSSLIIFVLYVVTFLRTINPERLPQIRRMYTMFMIVSVGLVALLGILGPVANARETRDDKLIESNLYEIKEGINDYSRANDQLPPSLNNVDFTGDTEKLVKRDLVEYTPNTKQPTTSTSRYSSSDSTTPTKVHYYELCVTYKKASRDNYRSYNSYSKSQDGYDTSLSTYDHPAGQACYKLKTTDY